MLKLTLLLLLGLLWSIRLAAIKAAGVAGIPPHIVVVLSALGIAIFFSCIALLRNNWPPLDSRQIRFYLLSGTLGFLAPFILESLVAVHLPVFVFVVIIASMPIFTFVLSSLIAKEPLQLLPSIAVTLGFVGAITILRDGSSPTQPNDADMHWIALAFGVPILYALNTVFISKRWPQKTSAVHVAHAQALIVFVAALAGSGLSFGLEGWDKPSLNLPAIGLIIMGEGLGLLTYLRITRDYGATYVSFANYVSMAFAAAIGLLVFQDQLTWLTLAGSFAIIFSIALFQNENSKETDCDDQVNGHD